MSGLIVGPHLYAVCVVMVVMAAAVYGLSRLGPVRTVPVATARAAGQLAAVSAVLASAMARLWTSVLVLVVMIGVATITAVRRAQAVRGAAWLTAPMLAGLTVSLSPLLLSRVVPLTGVALIPIVGIVLGGTMTSSAVAARLTLNMLEVRWGEVEAALSLGFRPRDARMEIIRDAGADALVPNLDQARTAGLVVLPGAFVGVLLSTGSAAQACVAQILVIVALLLSQSCAVALTCELVARSRISRDGL